MVLRLLNCLALVSVITSAEFSRRNLLFGLLEKDSFPRFGQTLPVAFCPPLLLL